MPISPTQTVFVILTGAAPPAGLARAAVRNGWPIHHTPPSRAQIEQALDRGNTSVVIIHIPVADDLAIDLIGSLRSSRSRTVIIAVSAAATEDAEIRARAAGAGLFLPASAEVELIERTVQALMVPPARSARSQAVVASPRTRTKRSSVI